METYSARSPPQLPRSSRSQFVILNAGPSEPLGLTPLSRSATRNAVGLGEARELTGGIRVRPLLESASMTNHASSRGMRRWVWIVALVGAAGCYVTAPIKPSELALLDGYHDGEPKDGTVSVLSPDNKPTEIAGDSQIFLDLPQSPWQWNTTAPEPGGTFGGTFKSIQVSGGVFNGVTDKGQRIQVPLASIQGARVTEPNRPLKGLLAVLIVAVGGLVLLTGVVYYDLAHQPSYGTGRALRVVRQPVVARAIEVRGWEADLPVAAYLPPNVRGALARLWTESARGEHASVPAFSRLSLSLVALGAPAYLVEAAHRAALEEIVHARLAFSLASAYAGEPVGPGPLPELQSASAVTATSLAALAAESLVDGCLLEGVAAEVARRALARARDPQARTALAVIARDEASHTALAWDVVNWCWAEGGDIVRRGLPAALRKAPATVTSPAIPAALADVLADHGWLGADVWADAFHAVSADVAARVAALAAG
jgi:hypothetical protein